MQQKAVSSHPASSVRSPRRDFLKSAGAAAAGVCLAGAESFIQAQSTSPAAPQKPTRVLHHGKILTVDAKFGIAEAMAVAGERILAVGRNDEILKLAGPDCERIDLQGRTVMPGLNDSHLHPAMASRYEFDHPIAEMETIADVLRYIRSRTKQLKPGQWIGLEQVFITRLREQRFPTRRELDEAAPNNPVWFRTGPDVAVNSLGLKLSGIDKDFRITDGQSGAIERDADGELTGMLRNGRRFAKYVPSTRLPTPDERCQCLKQMLAAYNEVGITSVTDRTTTDDYFETYQALHRRGELSCRVFATYFVDAQQPWETIASRIALAAKHPLRTYNNMLWQRGVKIYLDGGMLTGSAYMAKPWGVSKIYSITDPDYRGLLFVQPDRLYRIAREALSHDMQLTAHCVGDGAFDALVAAYDRVDKDFRVRPKRPCISHGNFMSAKSIETARRIGAVVDMQPVWLWLDGATLRKQFGDDRLAYFQPYKTLWDKGVMISGGSDHLQKIGRRRSINSYDPFLGMWTALVRQPRWTDRPLHTEQCISREQAIRMYTTNSAYVTFQENEKGSLEKGKLADFIVLDRDILACPVDEVKDINVLETYLGGKRVYAAKQT